MSTREIDELKRQLSLGDGFGDPETRKNVELRLQTLLSERVDRTAKQMNVLTCLLVVIAIVEAIFHAIEIWA